VRSKTLKKWCQSGRNQGLSQALGAAISQAVGGVTPKRLDMTTPHDRSDVGVGRASTSPAKVAAARANGRRKKRAKSARLQAPAQQPVTPVRAPVLIELQNRAPIMTAKRFAEITVKLWRLLPAALTSWTATPKSVASRCAPTQPQPASTHHHVAQDVQKPRSDWLRINPRHTVLAI